MRRGCIFLIVLVWVASSTAGSRQILNVLDWGAKPDGMTLNTGKLQAAIDRLADTGGGRLYFPPGCYVTGSLFLRSGVEVYLERGALLQGSVNPFDYVPLGGGEQEVRKDNSRLALILAENADRISLCGEGKIDGRGLEVALAVDSLHHAGLRIDPLYNYKRMRPNETARPKLFFFTHCRGVVVEDLELCNSASWGLSFDLCRDVRIRNLDISNRAYWNNDGIDITDCRNVAITGCRIDSADDGICLKSYHPDACNDSICITDCAIASSASAVKFGTASWGGFRNIVIDRIKVRDTFRSAIAIESVDGAFIEHVSVSNVEAMNTGNALFVRLGHRSGDKPGRIRDVRIAHLYCEVPFGRPDIDYDLRGPEVDFFHNPFPASVTGIPGASIESISLEDIEIVYPGRASKSMAYMPLSRLDQIPEKVRDYPEYTMFGELPAWGLYVRHVQELEMRRVRLRLKDKDFRPAILLDDVERESFSDLLIPGGVENIVRHYVAK